MKKCLEGSEREGLRGDERTESSTDGEQTDTRGAGGEDAGRARAVDVGQQQQCLIRASRAEQCSPLPLHTTDLPV